MEKTDLTEYGEDELSLNVMNTEYFYLNRHNSDFIRELGKHFDYTEEQLSVLIEDLKEDLEDDNI